MWTDGSLKSLYNQAVLVEMMSGDQRVLWIIDEYIDALEKRIQSKSTHVRRRFETLSTQLWALEEIRNRVIFKNVHDAMFEIECFIEQADTYRGALKSQKRAYEVAANTAQTIYDRLSDEFTK